jgi:hypothetical protein
MVNGAKTYGSGGMDGVSVVTTLRSAIFVDFDNMYLGLRGMDVAAAEAFATNPGRLLTSLEQGEGDIGVFRRRFLLKACYLNPEAFRRFRGFFVSAGFRVVDCPSLTQQGKSAADINLVLDVVDALAHQTRFDEFIICSADADFTPLMTRLRAHDRRTVMVAAGPAAPAYQSVCDQTVTPIQLAEAFTSRVAVSSAPAVGGPGPTDLADAVRSRVPLTLEDLRHAAKAVRDALDVADGVMPGAGAASAARRAVPHIAAERWGGLGFSDFVERQLPELVMLRTEEGGFLLDPAKQSAADVLADRTTAPDDLPAQVSRVTKVPRLSSEQYRALFESLAVLSRQPPALNRIGVEIRESTAAAGDGVPRQAANFVVQGLIYAGADPRNGERDAWEFATKWRDNVLVLCERAGMELDADGKTQIDAWLLGAIPAADG